MTNNSAKFIVPALELNLGQSLFPKEFKNSYLGYNTDEYDGNVYLHYTSTIEEDFQSKLKNSPYFKEVISTNEGLLFKYELPEDIKTKVVEPFIKGKYSLIDKAYVDKHFPESNERFRGNRMVCYKSPAYKKYWEDKIGTKLPDDAEVWSKPKKEDEIFNYSYKKEIAEIVTVPQTIQDS